MGECEFCDPGHDKPEWVSGWLYQVYPNPAGFTYDAVVRQFGTDYLRVVPINQVRMVRDTTFG